MESSRTKWKLLCIIAFISILFNLIFLGNYYFHYESPMVTVLYKKNVSHSKEPKNSDPKQSQRIPSLKVHLYPKVWKYEPPTGPLSTRPAGTMHPDSVNPDRTYNTEPPSLPQCHSQGDSVVSIYMESYQRLSSFFPNVFVPRNITSCNLPNDVHCQLQNHDQFADAVFRFVYFADPSKPLRYCKGQSLIAFNSEALRSVEKKYQQLDLADIRIDQFLTSDAYWKPFCFQYLNISYSRTPSNITKRSKAAALFLSDCDHNWRNDYIKELMTYIHVDSYGKCFHNVQSSISRNRPREIRNDIVSTTVESYRMMITFENLIQEDYITEKIWVAYQGGAIPIYMGPPDIYKWVPGNHTFIDPRNFAGPKELAAYMKRVAEDDELFKYHTSNFDWERTKRMMDKYCPKADFECRMCELVYKNIIK